MRLGGMGIICACLPVCWPLILRMTNLSVLSKFRTSTTKHGRKSSGSGSPLQRWWHNYKPAKASSWASSSVTIGLSQLSRDERSNKRATTYAASELRRASDTEVPILAASARYQPGVAVVDDGHECDDPALYAPQVRVWSDAGQQTRPMDQAVHVIKRCEYPI